MLVSARPGDDFVQVTGKAMSDKRLQLDEETWDALDLLAEDRMMSFQEFRECCASMAARSACRKHCAAALKPARTAARHVKRRRRGAGADRLQHRGAAGNTVAIIESFYQKATA